MAHHVEVVHDPSGGTGRRVEAADTRGYRLVMDSGEGMTASSPIDTLLAALGGCTAMDVIDILRKKRQTVTAYRVVVEGERRDTHPRVFTRITVRHVVHGPAVSAAAVADAVRLSDERYCAVHAMLAASVPIETRFEVHDG